MSESLSDRLRPLRRTLGARAAQSAWMRSLPENTTPERWVDAPALLALGPEDFVRALYTEVLGRDPDNEGYALFLSHVRNGAAKQELLRTVAQSQEARLKNVRLRGLDRVFDPSNRTHVERFIRALCMHCHGHEPHPDSLARWVELIGSGSLTRDDAVALFAASAEPARITASSFERIAALELLISEMRLDVEGHQRTLEAMFAPES